MCVKKPRELKYNVIFEHIDLFVMLIDSVRILCWRDLPVKYSSVTVPKRMCSYERGVCLYVKLQYTSIFNSY